MKLSELPKYHKENYTCDLGFGYLKTWLEGLDKQTKDEFGEEYSLDLNPDFQRGHIWTVEQKVKFIEHVLMDGQSGLDIIFNASFYKVDDYKPMDTVCVDGLQRISAVTDFMDGKFSVFSNIKYGGYKIDDFSDKMRFKNFRFNAKVGSFQSKSEVVKWYLQINDGGTPHSKEEIERVKEMLKDLKDT